MYEKFTDRARRVLVLAQQEAHAAGHEEITPNHVLLGCVLEHHGIAGRVLETFAIEPVGVRARLMEVVPRRSTVSPVEALAAVGVNLLEVKEAVEAAFGAGSFPLPGERPPFDVAARGVLKASLDAAIQWGHNYVGTEHLLLGVLRAEGGQARASLDALGAVAEEVERRTAAVVHRYTLVEQQPQRARARDLRRGVQRLPDNVMSAGRKVLNETVNAQPVMPLVASDAEFDSWLSETEAQLSTAVDQARDHLASLGALGFVDSVASLMKTDEAAELQTVIDGLRDERDKLQTSDADDEQAVQALAEAVRRERSATELADDLWAQIWRYCADGTEIDFVGLLTTTTQALRALP